MSFSHVQSGLAEYSLFPHNGPNSARDQVLDITIISPCSAIVELRKLRRMECNYCSPNVYRDMLHNEIKDNGYSKMIIYDVMIMLLRLIIRSPQTCVIHQLLLTLSKVAILCTPNG